MVSVMRPARTVAKVAIAAGVMLGLAGCEMDMGATGTSVDPARRPVRAVTLPLSGVSVAGPSGYCVDPVSVRDSARGSFALLGNCTGLSGRNNPALKGKTAVLTLSVAPPMTETEEFDPPSYEAYFASETGRRALSRSGSAKTVQLIESEARGDMVLLHVRDSAPMTLRGQGREYWRALFLLDGRLVTATATPFAEAPMSGGQLRALLDRFVIELKRRNPS
ncbi:hypothetical protein [Celeribacter ethanolicus]|uniref:hypothetical protein n=1 Tax=Celeribacter ethanolicus TaxID=1758178 RepID=UPI0008346A65|nr:hypothetical protein [Celeribacter ethanolicus]